MPPKTRAERISKSDQQLSSDRKVTLISLLAAFVFLVVSLYAFNQLGQRYVPVPHIHSLTDRIVWTLRYQVLGLLAIIWSISHVSLTRLMSPAINPLSGHESVVDKSTRILTNSLEQFVVNAINQLILSTYLSESNLRLIPLLNVYFLIGRLTFWIGYQIGPKYRTFGFVVSFWPTLITFGLNLYFLLTTNTNYLFEGGKPFGRPV